MSSIKPSRGSYMDNHYITKKEDKWQFKKQGSDRAIKNSSTKKEIVSYMQNYMKNKKVLSRSRELKGSSRKKEHIPGLRIQEKAVDN